MRRSQLVNWYLEEMEAEIESEEDLVRKKALVERVIDRLVLQVSSISNSRQCLNWSFIRCDRPNYRTVRVLITVSISPFSFWKLCDVKFLWTWNSAMCIIWSLAQLNLNKHNIDHFNWLLHRNYFIWQDFLRFAS